MKYSPILAPIAYTLLLWWFSTGVILYLDGLPRRTFRWSLAGATMMLAAAFAGIASTAADTTAVSAYIAFTCAIAVWGWVEMTFLMGALTGTHRDPCPPGCGEWRRFALAAKAILYHEFALTASAAAVVALTWNAPNQTATWAFLILWAMRTSAKLNMFLGVRNLYESFLPDHLAHLKSYFVRRPMNLLFPVAVGAGGLICLWIWTAALDQDAGTFEASAYCLVAMLLTLGVMEHRFLVIPLPTEVLWKWAMKSRNPQRGIPENPVARSRLDPNLFSTRK